MPLMLAPASHCTRISFTPATRILLRPTDHLRLRCGHGRGHLLRTARWQIAVNSYLVNSDEQNRPYSGKLRRTATPGTGMCKEPATPVHTAPAPPSTATSPSQRGKPPPASSPEMPINTNGRPVNSADQV